MSCPTKSSPHPPSVSGSVLVPVMSVSPLAAPAPCWEKQLAHPAGSCRAPPGKQSLCLWQRFRFRFYKLLPSLHRAGKVELFVLFALDTILLLITLREAQRFLGLEETITVIQFGKHLPLWFWVLSKRKMLFVFLCPQALKCNLSSCKPNRMIE